MSDAHSSHSTEPLSPWTSVWLVLLGVSIFVVLVFTILNSTRDEVDLETPKGIQRSETLEKLRTDEENALTTYEILDAEGGVVRIPIEAAMKLEIETLRKKPKTKGPEIQEAELAGTSVKPGGSS